MREQRSIEPVIITRRGFIAGAGGLMGLGVAGGLAVTPSTAEAAVGQTILIRDSATGKGIPNASVTVFDGFACYAPVNSNAAGNTAWNTNGIRTIQVRHRDYGGSCVTVNQSKAAYTVSLAPVPANQQHSFLGQTTAIAADVLSLLQKYGFVTKLGAVPLKDIDKVLGAVGVAATFCEYFPVPQVAGPCKLAKVVAGFGAGTFLAQNVFGVPADKKFTFYLLNVGWPPVLFVVP